MQETLNFIKSRTNNFKPEIGIILGSGLGDFAKGLESFTIPYSEIPGFATSGVHGHKNQLIFSKIAGKNVVIMQGRYHFYEGHPMQKIVYPIKIMKKLAVKTLIITNAAGAVNKDLKAADLMLITDHINLMGTNPLIGENDETLGTRFPDMSEIYKKDLIKLAQDCAQKNGFEIKSGVYAAFSGPSYETPAEINMLRLLKADAVGMSTIPEAIVANYCGMNVLGISCITNAAAGINTEALNHNEVIEAAKVASEKFKKLLFALIEKI